MDLNNPLDYNVGTNLGITDAMKMYLKEIAKWAKLIAIVGFVFVGLFVLIALFMGAFMGAMMGELAPGPGGGAAMGFLSFFYIIFAVIYFFPLLYLYRFSTQTNAALASNDQQLMTEAFSNLKSHYKFIGILMLISIGFMVLSFVMGLIGAAAAF